MDISTVVIKASLVIGFLVILIFLGPRFVLVVIVIGLLIVLIAHLQSIVVFKFLESLHLRGEAG